jgi:hypothetical protein
MLTCSFVNIQLRYDSAPSPLGNECISVFPPKPLAKETIKNTSHSETMVEGEHWR